MHDTVARNSAFYFLNGICKSMLIMLLNMMMLMAFTCHYRPAGRPAARKLSQTHSGHLLICVNNLLRIVCSLGCTFA